jgi:hypothetical protein
MMPVTVPTVATVVLLLAHVPPGIELPSVVAAPVHKLLAPVIAPGAGFTVTTVVVAHPVDSVYEIIEVPEETPSTEPSEGLTIATEGLLLDHVPPVVPSERVVDAPVHTVAVPIIVDGSGLTVTTTVLLQPLLIV